MEKGKFGIRMAFYAVGAFVLAVLGWEMPLFLLAGIVLFVEKDEWTSRQVIQAICLMVLPSLVSVIFNALGFIDWLGWFGGIFGTLYGIWNKFQSVIYLVAKLAVYIFGFLAIMKVSKGKEAGIPFADKFANWAYGNVVEKVKPVVPVAPAQPAAQPVAPAQPAAQPVAPAQPAAAPVANCTNCGAPLNGAAFCTQCGTPVAK